MFRAGSNTDWCQAQHVQSRVKHRLMQTPATLSPTQFLQSLTQHSRPTQSTGLGWVLHIAVHYSNPCHPTSMKELQIPNPKHFRSLKLEYVESPLNYLRNATKFGHLQADCSASSTGCAGPRLKIPTLYPHDGTQHILTGFPCPGLHNSPELVIFRSYLISKKLLRHATYTS